MPKRFRLSTLVVLAPLLAIVVALGAWVLALREEVSGLEARVSVLESLSPPITMNVSPVGVPYDIDWAMLMEAATMPLH